MISPPVKPDTSQKLLEAGHRLFWRNGYNATGVQEIANAAGVPKGSFYNHFENKEQFAARIIELYAKWVSVNWDGLLAQEEIASQDDHVARIRLIFHFFIEHHERSEYLGCLVGNMTAELAESSPACNVVLRRAMAEWSRRLTRSLELAQACGQVRTDMAAHELSALFLAAWEGSLLQMKLTGSTEAPRKMVSSMLDILFRPPL
jgi:TetR/AcrR family transcriptional repressor of nem operon